MQKMPEHAVTDSPAGSSSAGYLPRLLKDYQERIVPAMKKEFGHTNSLAVPRLVKIVVNMGVGEAVTDPKSIEKSAKDLSLITGQKPKVNKARKAISNFKIKEGMNIGTHVTLRKYRMYEFLDRLVSVAFPRIKDFRGFSPRSFDGKGNYSLGLKEQNIFMELETDRLERSQGMDITIVTTARTDKEALGLLKLFGFPFKGQVNPDKE
jgi:large subunit ribosomal protein L5